MTSSVPSMFVLISQIPLEFHTPDLRNFFSYTVEKESFVCFNYRHRPHSSGKFNMCVCKVKSCKFDELINLYDKKNWIDFKGRLLPSKCSIVKIKMTNSAPADIESNQLTEKEIRNLLEFKKILKWMPNGNVGTPTKIFIEYINQCIMPQSLIARLGLNLKAYKTHKKRIYSNVEFDYGVNKVTCIKEIDKTEIISDYNKEEIQVAVTANGHKIIENIDDEKLIKEINYLATHGEMCCLAHTSHEKNEEQEDNDADELEDWERHESLHEDVTKQDRTSPYFYENEIELKWEKGGSGLVFYTDNNFWQDHEGKDFDAETADDVDVDMSGYYEANGGDKDAQDLIQMRREMMLRNGESEHLFDDQKFTSKLNPFHRVKNNTRLKKIQPCIGAFEKYTKGFGRRILEKQGWKEGESIGKRNGLKEALDASEGKHTRDKTGLGYVGEKINKEAVIAQQKINIQIEKRSQPHYIASKYDDNNTSDTLLRRFEPIMKYRQNKTS